MRRVTIAQQTTMRMIFESEKFREAGTRTAPMLRAAVAQAQCCFCLDMGSTEEIAGGEKSCD